MADTINSTGSEFVFSDWLELFQKYRDDMEKELETVRLHKKEVQNIRQEIYDRYENGYFLRDDKRIVISAPEIIIGNVNKSGQLLDSTSTVVIRSSGIDIQGVGDGGYIRNKATFIEQRAVDSGCDGLEEVVHDNASVMTQARSILLDSNDSTEVYTRDISQKKMTTGIAIHTDTVLDIDASVSRHEWTKAIEDKVKVLNDNLSTLKKEVDEKLDEIKGLFDEMEKDLEGDQELLSSEIMSSTNIGALESYGQQLADRSIKLSRSIDSFLVSVSLYAEQYRQQKALTEAKMTKSEDEFKNNVTGAGISINAEQIDITNTDGDHAVRENDGTYLRIMSKNIFVGAVNGKNENHEKGTIALRGESILVETNDRKKNGDDLDMPTTGKVEINSKEILVSSLDYEQKKDQERTEKNLTEEGNIRIRAKKINVDGTDLEGTAAGELTMNSGKISVVSAEVDKESREIKEIHKGGTLELATETVTIGKDAAEKILSEKIEAKTNTELKLIQGDKATLTVSGNKLTVEDDGTNFSKGELTVDVESKFNKKMTATTIEANDVTGKKVTVNNCLKAPSLTAQG
ncbi:hypothetical protein [Phocaeicola barnesiae]|uniref:Uncharacterized protein n=1 Tax=Phocaeicola barnesiae TaxID=376804 RepID=A0AAW5MWA4_9BACT|nr:hypothetical protein [Phocaeicola barnesiae]MCR8872626.1 hypothetical protein [Phocaeicola barnesiae]